MARFHSIVFSFPVFGEIGSIVCSNVSADYVLACNKIIIRPFSAIVKFLYWRVQTASQIVGRGSRHGARIV